MPHEPSDLPVEWATLGKGDVKTLFAQHRSSFRHIRCSRAGLSTDQPWFYRWSRPRDATKPFLPLRVIALFRGATPGSHALDYCHDTIFRPYRYAHIGLGCSTCSTRSHDHPECNHPTVFTEPLLLTGISTYYDSSCLRIRSPLPRSHVVRKSMLGHVSDCLSPTSLSVDSNPDPMSHSPARGHLFWLSHTRALLLPFSFIR